MIEINNLTNFAVDKKSFSQVAKKVLSGENRRTENLSFTSATMKLKYLKNISGGGSLSFSSRGPEPATQNQIQDQEKINCFLSCQNYLDLKIDYEILETENQKLRDYLYLSNFHVGEDLTSLFKEYK